jgi:hypothetical protein
MNQNNRSLEISINRLSTILEALEEYIRRTGHYSDWKDKEQFCRRTMPGYKNEENKKWALERAESHFFSQFYVSCPWFRNETKSFRQETQKEFYKWIDHSGITAKNCLDKLKHYLNEINEALESGNSSLHRAYKAANEKEDIFDLAESPFYRQANSEVSEFFGYANEPWIESPKYYEAKIEGNAERGQKTFQQIKNSITSQPEWTFPLNEKYYQKLKERIEELEGKGGNNYQKEDQNYHVSSSYSQKKSLSNSIIFEVLSIGLVVIFSLGAILIIKKKKNKK